MASCDQVENIEVFRKLGENKRKKSLLMINQIVDIVTSKELNEVIIFEDFFVGEIHDG